MASFSPGAQLCAVMVSTCHSSTSQGRVDALAMNLFLVAVSSMTRHDVKACGGRLCYLLFADRVLRQDK
jgi:hypothetical protein